MFDERLPSWKRLKSGPRETVEKKDEKQRFKRIIRKLLTTEDAAGPVRCKLGAVGAPKETRPHRHSVVGGLIAIA